MIKDLVVQLTGSAEDAVRLAYAEEIAAQFQSHLIGVHLHTLPNLLDIADPSRSGFVQDLLEQSNAQAEQSFAALTERFAQLRASHELRRLHGLPASIGVDLVRTAREADLFVGTRPYGDPEALYRIEEAVLFGSGRGCLFLPPGGTPHKTFDTVLVAWDDSRAAARAIAEAMPFLRTASSVLVGQVVTPGETSTQTDERAAPLVRHLERYGLSCRQVHTEFRDNTGEQLGALAHQHGADLIVMGAYGHPKLIEWSLGGATRHILRHSTLPVMMAH
jgi:nucleotide-binding universal stress UspA family protein